jgi:hypothetical protein
MKNTTHADRKSHRTFGLTGQNNGTLTKKQRAQSLADKDRHARELLRAFAMRGNPQVNSKRFTILGQPGTQKDVLDLKRQDGSHRYGRTSNGVIIRRW